MAKHPGRLTKQVAKNWQGILRRDGKLDPILWDGDMPGFGIKVNGSGTHSAIIDYRNRYGTKRRYTLGRLTDSMTLEQARTKAGKLLGQIAFDGFDPLGAEKVDRQAPTMNEIFDAYLVSAKFESKAESTQGMDKSRIKRHLRPTLGKDRVAQVTPDKVRKAYAAIRDGRTAVVEKTQKKRGKARVTGGAAAATSCIKLLSAIFSWSIQEGLAKENPCDGIQTAPTGVREAILDQTEQYTALFDALQALQETAEIPDAAADAIRVLAFTGARRNEVTEARWSWVDLTASTLTVPAKGHKAGHRSGKVKVIPLPAQAKAVIEARPRGEPGDFVFPGTRGDSAITLPSKLWKAIRAKSGLPDGITNHSLRHSLGTMMAVQGAEAAQIMAALGHSQMSTTQRYIHIAKDARAAMLEKYTAGIAAAIAPKAEVVDIKKGAKK